MIFKYNVPQQRHDKFACDAFIPLMAVGTHLSEDFSCRRAHHNDRVRIWVDYTSSLAPLLWNNTCTATGTPRPKLYWHKYFLKLGTSRPNCRKSTLIRGRSKHIIASPSCCWCGRPSNSSSIARLVEIYYVRAFMQVFFAILNNFKLAL